MLLCEPIILGDVTVLWVLSNRKHGENRPENERRHGHGHFRSKEPRSDNEKVFFNPRKPTNGGPQSDDGPDGKLVDYGYG